MSDLAGSLLLRHGIVKPDQISAAHALRQRDGGSFGEALVRIGAIDEEALVEFYHKRLMIQRVPDMRLLQVSPKVLGLVPPDMAAEFRVVPIEVDNEGTVTLAMADPTNNHAVDEVAFFADRFVVRAVATESAVRRAIETHYGVRFTSPKATDRVTNVPAARPPAAKTPRAPAATPASPVMMLPKVELPPSTTAPPPATTAVKPAPATAAPKPKKREEPAKPTREAIEEQIVLLTKVKRSEETPLPMPVPPPDDYKPEFAVDIVEEEPILLTKPKQVERERRDTLPSLTVPVPDPPLAQLKQITERDAIAREVLDYVALMTRRSIFFVVKKSLLVAQDSRGELDPQLVKQLAINIEAPSIFRDVIASRLPYRGPLPEVAANRAFAQMIGGIGPEILLMPVAVRERIIAVLFADGPTLVLPDAALHATTREAGLAYERIILEHKGR